MGFCFPKAPKILTIRLNLASVVIGLSSRLKDPNGAPYMSTRSTPWRLPFKPSNIKLYLRLRDQCLRAHCFPSETKVTEVTPHMDLQVCMLMIYSQIQLGRANPEYNHKFQLVGLDISARGRMTKDPWPLELIWIVLKTQMSSVLVADHVNGCPALSKVSL